MGFVDCRPMQNRDQAENIACNQAEVGSQVDRYSKTKNIQIHRYTNIYENDRYAKTSKSQKVKS